MSIDGIHYLRPALAPRSIAVVGASHRPESFGRFVMNNVMSAGFSGDVFAVNPKHRTVDGRPCLPSLRALSQKVDLAIVVTAARHVPGIVDDAAARGIPAMLVLSPGLCDQGPDVRRIEQEVVQRARRGKVRLFGPNCLGLMRPDIGLNASWARTVARPGNIALVSQEPVLFDDSILENIRLGREGATEAEVRAAARLAGALAFIESLPEGFATRVGERGARLSGGQRQRVSIARAFLKDAPILILDEATSALDTETERGIQASLQLLMKGRTTLIVAHRFSTIRDVDRVLVFDAGRVVADGPREEVYRSNELFRRLWDNQSQGLG